MNPKPIFTLITNDYPPNQGGVARYLSELVKAANGAIRVVLPKQKSGDNSETDPSYKLQVTSGKSGDNSETDLSDKLQVTSGKSGDNSETDPSYKLQVTSGKFSWFFWPHWLPLIQRCLEAKGTTLLISHVLPIGTAAFIAKLLGGPEYVIIFHGTDLQRIKTRWKKFLLHLISSRAQLLIVNSRATAGALKRLYPKADPLILTPGVTEFAPLDKTQARTKLNLSNNAIIILAVARLVERKGIDTLIQACAKLLITNYQLPITNDEIRPPSRSTRSDPRTTTKSYDWVLRSPTPEPPVEVVVIGNGPEQETLKNLALINRVNVRWVGEVSETALRDWYSSADIFCLPAREQADDVEGFGMVFLEAAMAGLPVIAGDSWGTGEAVVNNCTGLLVQPDVEHVAQALSRLLQDQELRTKLGTAGRKRAIEEFSWADRWNSLLSRINSSTHELELGTRTKHYDWVLRPPSRSTRSDFSTSRPLDLSVVIPCWNHAKELEATLRSLALQTLQPAQVIVVDDASDDNPKIAVDRFVGKLNIQFLRLPQRSGAPVARNTGAAKSSSKYIIFLDADAVLVSDALQTLLSALEQNPQAAFAYSDFMWGRHLFKSRAFSATALKQQNYIHTSALIRREQTVPFDEKLAKFQDWDLWLTMVEQGRIGVRVPRVLFQISERKHGISHWLPAFAYKIPWPIFGWTPKSIIRYCEAERIVKQKHGLL